MDPPISLSSSSSRVVRHCAENDDWVDVTDPAERRRRQNRQNQRIYRRRMNYIGKTLATKTSDPKLRSVTASNTRAIARSERDDESRSKASDQCHASSDSCTQPPHVAGLRGIRLRNATVRDITLAMAYFEAQASACYTTGSPRSEQLLTLIQFNVIRALFGNSAILGLGHSWLSADAVSLFPLESQSSSLPTHLHPTDVQKRMNHHPWIDLFPVPALRDNVIQAGDAFDEDDLCNDLVDFNGISHEKTGLIVWNTPWETGGWEVSEAFVTKWAWALVGCDELLASTNYWRARRGESALKF